MRAILLSLALAGALCSQDQPLPDGASLLIVVQEVQGEVDVRIGPKDKWIPAEKGLRLAAGSKICTGVEGGAVVSFGTNSVATVAECTVCEIRAFEMQGDELVASIHLEPGVARVHVQQLAQFHTDFRVSTPRLTCSVKGSIGWFVSQCDEIADVVLNEQGRVGTDRRELARNERTNSKNDANLAILTRNNEVDLVTGLSDPEEEGEDDLTNNNGGISLNTSDVNVDTDSSPDGGDDSFEDFEPENGVPQQIQDAWDFLAAHGYGEFLDYVAYGGDEYLRQTAQDQRDGVNTRTLTDEIYQQKHDAMDLLADHFGTDLHDHHGIDWPHEHDLLHAWLEERHAERHALANLGESDGGDGEPDWHELAHEDGLDATLGTGTDYMENVFHNELIENESLDQAARDARDDDFHDGEFGFDAMENDMQALVDQAATGDGFDPMLFGKSLIELLRVSVLQEMAELPNGNSPGEYGFEYPSFQQDVVDDLSTILQETGAHDMIDAKADHLHDFWHDNTGVAENVAQGEPGYDEHQQLHNALDAFKDQAHYAVDHAQD